MKITIPLFLIPRMMKYSLFLHLAVQVLLCVPALAHEAGITDTDINIFSDRITVVYTVPEKLAITIYPKDDESVLHTAVLSGLSVTNANTVCSGRFITSQPLAAIGALQATYSFNCGGAITELGIKYDLFFEQDASHVNIVRFALHGESHDVTLDNDNRAYVLYVKKYELQLAEYKNNGQTGDKPGFDNFTGTQYFPIGMKHILYGFDHLLFLVCLVLLPMRPWNILGLLTSFTIAHSITLSLSVLDIVTLTPRWVEMMIAFSIVYVSMRTIMILRRSPDRIISKSDVRERLLTSFLFGLIHGFGFSFLLKEIGLGDQIFSSLLFFNLGVEAGQLLVLVFLIPFILWLCKRFPSLRWAQGASLITGIIGTFWFLQRLGVTL